MSVVFAINGTQVPKLPDAGSLQVTAEDVASTQTSEAGTTLRQVTRRRVHKVTATWTMPAAQTKTLAALTASSPMTLNLWLPDTGETTLSVYAGSFNPALEAAPHGPDASDALWKTTLEFTEY